MNLRSSCRDSKQLVTEFQQKFHSDEYFRLTVAVIFVWGFLDTASTYVAVGAHGSVQNELNPLARELLFLDPYYLTFGKGIGVLAIGLLSVFGKQFIISVPGWKVFFHSLLWIGVVVAVLNLYAAYTAVTGTDPVFSLIVL